MKVKNKPSNKAHKKHKFVVSHHKPITKHGLAAEATSQTFKVTEAHGIKMALIPKKNLGINPEYQRPLHDDKVNKIKSEFSQDIYDLASVFHAKVGGENYYQITNGQHRVCAYPKDVVPCRIVNTLAPCTRFLQANDPKKVSPLKQDEIFWGKVYEAKTTGNGDPDGVLKLIKMFKKHGYKPSRDVKGATDFGAKIAVIHNHWRLNIKHNYAKLRLSKTAFDKLSLHTLDDAFEIITGVFGHNTFSRRQYNPVVWGSMMDWLSNESYMDGKYSTKDVINTLRKGRWAFNGAFRKGKGKIAIKKAFVTLDDWKMAALEYRIPGRTRHHQEWRSLIDDVYAISAKY